MSPPLSPAVVQGSSLPPGEDAVRMASGDEAEAPEGGGGVLLADSGGDSVTFECWILASVESWVRSGRSRDDVVQRMMVSFDLTELRKAARRFQKGNWAVPNIGIVGEGTVGYSRKLAESLFDGMSSVLNMEKAPVKFYISAADLHRVPGAEFVDRLDEPAVSVRLGGLDDRLERIMEKLSRSEQLEGTVAALARTVTSLQEQLKQQQAEAAAKVPPQPASWAAVANKGRGRADALGLSGRQRSVSVKRRGMLNESDQNSSKQPRIGSQDEVLHAVATRAAHTASEGSALSQDLAQERNFQQVVRKRKGSGVKKGSSQVQADGAEAAPFSVFISGTSPACKVETVKEKLVQCAAAVNAKKSESERKELEILKVDEILLKIPQGEERRSRCWKVTVQPEFAEHMMTSEAYPAAWGFRKWQRGPSRPTLPHTQENVNGDGGA